MKNNTPLVSIIIPVHNSEFYLSFCLDSVLSQTLSDIEILLIDDGSTDHSGLICDDFALKDSRIKVAHLVNGGPSRARNHGIRMASGKYIGFIDSDDYIAPEMFETLVSYAEIKQSDLVMCGYNLVRCGTISSVYMDYSNSYTDADAVKDGLLQRYYTKNHTGLYSLCNKLFSRKLIMSNHIRFNESLIRAEDAWFVFDYLKISQCVTYLPQTLYYYRQNEASIMHTVYENQYEQWVRNRKRLLLENENLCFNIDYDNFYHDFLIKTVLFCRTMIQQNNPNCVKDIFEDPMYLTALHYRKTLPIHIRLLLFLTQLKAYNLAILLYRIWGGR